MRLERARAAWQALLAPDRSDELCAVVAYLLEGYGTHMLDLLVYVDTSDVREGALEELKPAIRELVDFVEANEPRLIAYNVYLSDDGARMTVLSVHPDSMSLEYHMAVVGPLLGRFVDLVTLSSIHIYGEPSEKVLKQSREKAQLLGRGAVVVESLLAGFTRLEPSTPERVPSR